MRHVIYPWWPENGDDWLHPEDAPLARQLIPSRRVFEIVGSDGPYRLLGYGKLRLRVRPTLCIAVRGENLSMGDLVEIRSRMGRRRPGLATISEMLWDMRYKRIEYRLLRRGMLVSRGYTSDDLVKISAGSNQSLAQRSAVRTTAEASIAF